MNQPQWQQQLGSGGPGYRGQPERPVGVLLGALWLIGVGALLALYGAACGVIGGAVSSVGPSYQYGAAAFGGSVLLVGIIMLVLGVTSIAAGVGAILGRPWARTAGVVVSALFVLGGLFLVATSVSANSNTLPRGRR